MKIFSTKHILFYLLTAFSYNSACAQIDLQCNSRDMHSIYFVTYTDVYRIDSVDTNPTNPVLLTSLPSGTTGSSGISINNNLDSIAGPVTMYVVGSSTNFHFWNGTGWTDTGHSGGSSAAVNPGGTANYIFNLDGFNGSLYRYDGTGNSTLLLSNLNASGAYVYDVATDNQGNFYLCNTATNKIIEYNPTGIPVDSFITTNGPTTGDCGVVLLGNRMYYGDCNSSMGLYEGIKTGNTINFTMIKTLSITFRDMAACPAAAIPLSVFQNTALPHFAVYPNPAHNVAVIKLDNTATLEITDYMGVLKKTIPVKGLSEYHLDLNAWKAGVYFIKASSANKTTARRTLIVQ